MIEPAQIRQYLALKRRLAAAVADPDASGFRPSQREVSEGLAKSLTLDGETWTYSTDKGGYRFSNGRRRFSVFVAEGGTDAHTFTSMELVGWLAAFTGLQNINQMVVDLWLVKAAMAGAVREAPAPRGHWLVVD